MTSSPWLYSVRQGGLMRCCLASLDEQMAERLERGDGPPQEGDKVSCRLCPDGNMIFRSGAWEWDR